MYVGLFSLKVDKIGITAEVGGYVQLWGYFYYHKTWQEKLGAASNSSGAMRIEIGIYIEIKFVAQAFSSSKLNIVLCGTSRRAWVWPYQRFRFFTSNIGSIGILNSFSASGPAGRRKG